MIKRYGIVLPGIALALVFLVFSCQKKGVNDFIIATHPVPDSSSDIRVVLKKSPFSLFLQAAQRIGLDSLLPASGYFTVFAPVDSAMVSAGLDQGHIASLSVDSLRKIVLFHVAQGAYSQGALSSAIYSVETRSLRKDLTVNPSLASSILYQQNLYLKISGDVLYINGDPAGNAGDTAWTASNGFIWPIRYVLQAPTQNIWQIVLNRPELSMYLMAMRIDDSIYEANGFLPTPPFVPGQYFSKSVAGDSISFSWVVYDNLPNTQYYGFARPTVFAPTNAAFAAAGIYTYQDILNYNSSEPNPGPVTDQNTWVTTWVYLPMDSVLKSHLILYAGTNTGVPIPYHLSLYNDLLFNPDINNGDFNTVNFWPLGNAANAPLPNPLLQFSGNNGTVNIKWQPGGPPAVLPADRSRHIMALNGAVYEIDKLFYPHN
jgi:uncharacterized surface protein with fasciclin (FAS1) repeats